MRRSLLRDREKIDSTSKPSFVTDCRRRLPTLVVWSPPTADSASTLAALPTEDSACPLKSLLPPLPTTKHRPLATTKLLLGLRLGLYRQRSCFSVSASASTNDEAASVSSVLLVLCLSLSCTDLQNPHSLNSVVVESNDILNDIQEQAEGLERVILHSDGYDTQQNEETTNEQEFQTNKRKKTSGVWTDFHIVSVDGVQKMVDQQTKLNFMPSDGVSSSIPLLHLGKFDMELMRESAANWTMMLKHPFTILEEVGFNLMMKRGWPE
nr:zinc finger BED domain-containing protein RICESLEEPER 4-like [Ipomoea trifida]